MYNSRISHRTNLARKRTPQKSLPTLSYSVPVARIGERMLVCDIVHEKNAHGDAAVSGGDGAMGLYAGRVPDLQFAALVIDFDSADLEVDADGVNIGRISIVREAEQQVALARALVSYYQQLDEVVILSVGICGHWQIEIYVERLSTNE